MNDKLKILYLINELQNTCGITSSLYIFLSNGKLRNVCDVSIICGGGDAIKKFREIGILVNVNKNILHQKRSILNYIMAHFQIWLFINRNKIKIIHSHHYYAASIIRNINKIFKVSTVMSCHGLIPETGRLNHYPADHIIAVNQHIYEYIIQHKIRGPEYVHLIRYGLTAQKVRSDYKRDGIIHFLAASRIEYEKGLDLYVKAISILSPEYKKRAEFSLAGIGSQVTEILNLIADLGVDIKYLGNVTDLKKVLEANDVFVMPTRSASEGFPMTILEASFSGNLIITSDFRGYHFVIEAAKDALVFKQEDFVGLSEIIKNVIECFDSYNPLAFSFRRKVEDLYALDKTISELLALYKSF